MRVFISSIAVLLTIAASGTGFSQPQTYLAPAEVRLKTAAYSEAFNELASRIDSRFYDVEGLAEHLDYDVQNAVFFVQDQIAYDPYEGVMKGPSGTISTQSGSSWDQAVLLAALINSMGGEAMLGVGTLTEKDAITLLKIGITSQKLPDDGLQNIDPKIFLEKKLGLALQEPSEDQNSAKYEEYQKAADEIAVRLITQLKASKKPVADKSEESALEYAKRLADEYVWVRYRDTPSDPWLESHPAFGGMMLPEVKAERYIAAKVPQEKLHKVKVRFYIETSESEKTKLIAITRDYIRPAANLAAHQIRMGISPNNPDPSGEPSFYTPVIDGIVQEGSLSFTPLGLTMSPEDAAAGPEIFRTVAKNVGNALGALNKADGTEEKTPRLTGIIINVTHVAPGGRETKTVRRLTDFREGMPKDYPQELVFEGLLEVNIGAENGAREYKAMLESAAILSRQLPYQRAFIDKELSMAELIRHPSSKKSLSHGWFPALQLGGVFTPSDAGGRVVRTSPLIMMRRLVPRRDVGFQVAVDIQHNATRSFALPSPDGLPIEDPRLSLRQGVLETLLEGELIEESGIPEWFRIDEFRVITDESTLEQDPLWGVASLSQRDRLMDDLKGSGALMLPNGQTERWWKIDLNTGQSLGMSEVGGAELAEAILLEVIPLIFTGGYFTLGMISGVQACNEAGGSQAMRTCCLAGVTALNTGMALGGAYVSGAANSARAISAANAGMSAAKAARYGALVGAVSSVSFDIFLGEVPAYGALVNDMSTDICRDLFSK